MAGMSDREPVAWAVFDGPDRMHLAPGYGEAESCAEDIGGEIVPLYRSPRWIPVSERLPEEGVSVLVWLADRSRAVVAYRRDKWWDGTDEELNFHSYTKVDDAEAPTHWMPLPPEPPEVK
jgi:hypothetical protein